MVTEIKSKSQLDKILNENERVVIDFWASWCGPCVSIMPAVVELSTKHTGVTFVKVNVDEESVADIVEKYEVEAMPTFVFIRNGQVETKVVGANKDKLTKTVETLAA
eukprot:CAMPEP_0117437752 /NCGR_PEP_ID=MMETSP0759-20121206/1694_1 /TAXON_ID=63605 /ORGANISM="Percolomonas cosmopolitus, Strain WS" /LENGTH=106 /DNA_ID=CAMNT_0005229411 /DNA_START=70 /DNA_END=390 /DNA_ORIENTATION=-